jgi:hypothetical protein
MLFISGALVVESNRETVGVIVVETLALFTPSAGIMGD